MVCDYQRDLWGRGGGKKLLEVWAWLSDRERAEYCRACNIKDCAVCDWRQPEIGPENMEALFFWGEIRTQWRVGISGPTGLDYPAVYLEAERLEIDLSISLMRKIKLIEQAELKRQNENQRQTKRPQPHSEAAQGRSQK